MIYAQLYCLLIALILGYRDGMSHQSNRILGSKQLTAWHFCGGLLYTLFTGPLFFLAGWEIFIAALLIRLAVFDVAYNKAAGLKLAYMGEGTEKIERVAIKVFGPNGAVKKMIVALAILIILNILHYVLA